MTHIILRAGFGTSLAPAFMIQIRNDWFGMIFPKRERIDRWTNYK